MPPIAGGINVVIGSLFMLAIIFEAVACLDFNIRYQVRFPCLVVQTYTNPNDVANIL